MAFAVFRVVRSIPDLGARSGDSIVVDLSLPNPVVIRRALPPNFGRLLLELESGALEVLTPASSVASLLASLPPAQSPAPSAPAAPGRTPGSRRTRPRTPAK